MTTFGGQLYRFTQLSSDTEITRSFVKLYFTPHTWSLCSANVCIHFRSARSQIFTLVSLEDEAKCLPSWENDTQSTQEEWPDKVLATSEWLLNIYIYEMRMVDNNNKKIPWLDYTYTSYNFMWPSSEAVKSICELGEKHKLRTGIAWPSKVWATFPAVTSKIVIIPSIAPLAIYLPSGLYYTRSRSKSTKTSS